MSASTKVAGVHTCYLIIGDQKNEGWALNRALIYFTQDAAPPLPSLREYLGYGYRASVTSDQSRKVLNGKIEDLIEHSVFLFEHTLPGSEANPIGDSDGVAMRTAFLRAFQKSYQVRLLLIGEADSEALIVEIHHVVERRGRAVVKVRRARRQCAQDRSLHLSQHPRICR